jgi:hypothetical protein
MLTAPTLHVVTVWIKLKATGETRFVTLFPDRRKDDHGPNWSEGEERDVAVVVEHLPATPESREEEGYALEVFNAVGETIAVVMVPASAVRPLREEEILHVRSRAAG